MLELQLDKNRLKYIKKGETEPVYISLIECRNPYCDCGESILVNYKDKFEEGLLITSNFKEKTLVIKEPDLKNESKFKEQQLLLSSLKNNLTNEDWNNISKLHYRLKSHYIEYTKEYDEEFNYRFPLDHILDKTLLISFKEIYPASEIFTVEKDEIIYELKDDYCKNPACDCNKMNAKVIVNNKPDNWFTYNFESQEVEQEEFKWIIEALKSKYEYFDMRVKARYGRIKNEYFDHLKLIEKQNDKIEKGQVLSSYTKNKKIGRNDPCPCGSGKKHKKCCLN